MKGSTQPAETHSVLGWCIYCNYYLEMLNYSFWDNSVGSQGRDYTIVWESLTSKLEK